MLICTARVIVPQKKKKETEKKGGVGEREGEKRGSGRFQIMKMNRSSCAQFCPCQLLKPAPLALRSERNPPDAFITHSTVSLGTFNIVSDRLPANE